MKLLFVVHRYYPFPGGSEYYTAAMAEEALRRGHEVSVFTGEHRGDQNGVRVTSDSNVLGQPWDLIVVHGGDVGVQNFVLHNATRIPSPILYMLILPSNSPVTVQALRECRYLGWSTPDDMLHLRQHGVHDKAHRVRHGIKIQESIGKPGFKSKYGIPDGKTMFLSCGGYWPNKKMRELADSFMRADLPDAVLVTTGYDNSLDLMPAAIPGRVIPLMVESKDDALSAISEADCYVMNSDREGFGLVILEAMLNGTPWISRQIAGASMLGRFGHTYVLDSQLVNILRAFKSDDRDTSEAKAYVESNHSIACTIDDIEKVISG